MIIEDNLYGKFSVSALIEELLKSKALERLKGIHQGGGIFLVNPELTLTRHEHSVGVMLLISLLGGTEIEQVAGLLHDISHTAFSHVADYIFEHPQEDYHEEIYHRILEESEIPEILARHGYALSDLTGKDFNILEQPLPNLCADRIDYALRDLFYAGFISMKEVKDFISTMIINEGRIMMSSVQRARWFRNKYEILNKDYFGKKEHLYANEKLTEILKYLLAKKVITQSDFERDDVQLLSLIEGNPTGKKRIDEIKRFKDYEEYIPGFTLKPRVIDPELFIDKKYSRLSEFKS
ncbi:HD domain-containing protein [Pedobacter sp. PAMC26386]|nr:HD domain-containing protein [Pedobacter sp. PAMC26386]